MIEIYFDNVLLDSDNYIGFSYSKKSFDKTFYLGSVSSVEASLIIPKDALPDSLDEVKVKIDNNDFLNLVVDSISINDNEEAEIKLTDKMINLSVPYDISSLVPISAKNLFIQICNDFGLEYNEFTFANEDVTISSHDSTLTAREYISMISELAGGYAQITNEGKLAIKYYSDEDVENEITAEDVDSYKIKEDITIERVVYEFGAIKKESDDDENKYTIYLNSDNLFLQVITDEQFNNICDKILSFTFSNIEIPTTNLVFANQDLIKFKDIDDNYHAILNEVEAQYGGGFIASYKYEIENSKQETTKILNNSESIKRIKILVDQEANTLTQTIQRVENLEENIDILKTDIDTNLVIISTNSSRIPFSSKTVTINHNSEYLGEPIYITPTTTDSYTGITCTTTNSQIIFEVDNETPLQNIDNKYIFTWSYNDGTTTFTTTKSITVSAFVSEVEQNVVISNERPSDINVLWYYINEHKLLRYDSTDQDWIEINDYDAKIDSVRELITGTEGVNNTIDALKDRIQAAEEDLTNMVDIDTYHNLETRVNVIQSDTYTKQEIQQIANGTGADGITVTAVKSIEAIFDINGMHYQKSTGTSTSTINEQGLRVDDKNGNEALFAGVRAGEQSSIVETENLTSRTYLVFGNNHGRLQQFTDPTDNIVGVGLFIL